MLHVPHVVDDELLRLPSVDEGEREPARRCTTRATRHENFTQLQLPGAARRRLHARPGQHGEEEQDRAGAVVERGGGQLAERQPRVALPPAADDLVAKGYSGQAFNPHFPHTVRTSETKTCTDCHVSRENDNNAWMAQLLLQGTNFVNFVGRYVYVGEGHHGFEAVAVTEHDEPQAVIGSYLHKLAYPENYAQPPEDEGADRGVRARRQRPRACSCAANTCTRPRAHDGVESTTSPTSTTRHFAERIVTAPVSPLGQRFR